MDIEQTTLYKEATDIINAKVIKSPAKWDVVIRANDEDIVPLKLEYINTERDYVKKYTDVTTCTVLMGRGLYARKIYPYRANLKLMLTKTNLDNRYNPQSDVEIETETFMAILIQKDAHPSIAQGIEADDQFSMDHTGIIPVHFQLLDEALGQLRATMTGGGWRNDTVENILLVELTSAAENIVSDKEKAITSVDVTEADNQDFHYHIPTPHGVSLMDFPDFLQARYGVYNSGLGSFIQNKQWFVYPLYRPDDVAKRQRTITFLIMPQKKYHAPESTYRVDGDAITVVITGGTAYADDMGSALADSGSGVRFGEADMIMDCPNTIEGNKTKVERNLNNSEFRFDTDQVGVGFSPVVKEKITANSFVHFSELGAKVGGGIRLTWENSDPGLIEPGMPIYITYQDREDTTTINGIVHSVSSFIKNIGGVVDKVFTQSSIIDIFINKPK